MKRIVITGGAGTLALNIVQYWLPKGFQFLLLDNFATSSRGAVPDDRGVTFVQGSVADEQWLKEQIINFAPDIIIHSAAAYKDPDDWSEDAKTNVLGTINVLAAAQACQVEKLINLQTALVYGEPQQNPVSVAHATAPITSYGITKLAGEQFLQLGTVPWVSLRLANICSPGLAIGPIPTFYQRLKAQKSCFCTQASRDFLDIDDFLALLELILLKPDINGIFNVSTGQATTIKQVYHAIQRYLKMGADTIPEHPVGEDDIAHMVLDPQETMRQFDWQAKIGFEQMLLKQLQWYDKHGVSKTYSHLKTNPTAE